MKGTGHRQLRSGAWIHRRLPEQIATKVPVILLKRSVRVVPLGSNQRANTIRRRGDHQQVALRMELPAGRLHHALLHHLARPEIDRPRRGEIAILRQIGPLVDIDAFDSLRNDEIEVGVPLAMRMGTQVDRHSVGKKCDIRAVIRIEPAQKILVGLAGAAGMFDGNKSRDEAEHLGRAPLRLEEIFLVGDELLRRGRHRTVGLDSHLRHVEIRRVGIVGERHQAAAQHHCSRTDQPSNPPHNRSQSHHMSELGAQNGPRVAPSGRFRPS